MPGIRPNPLWVYRILHWQNVEYVLQKGIYTRNSINVDPDYINIGLVSLIDKRNHRHVQCEPGGVLNDYVPFYFGYRSPMLFMIQTGWQNQVVRRHPQDIVYLCCKVDDIIERGCEFVFMDGHAVDAGSTPHYNDIADIDAVDWDAVKAERWQNTEDDNDKKRKKQAEFLVKEHVPVECISKIVVYNELRKTYFEELVEQNNLEITVKANPGNKYYY